MVDAVGDGVEGVREGDEVVVLPGVSCGACEACQQGLDHLCRHYDILGESCDGTAAEYICLPAANVAPKPRSLGMPEAASVCLVFQTAWNMLVRRAELRAGETVLVHAGLSGVGSAAVQIANALGAQVIATAGGSAAASDSTAAAFLASAGALSMSALGSAIAEALITLAVLVTCDGTAVRPGGVLLVL